MKTLSKGLLGLLLPALLLWLGPGTPTERGEPTALERLTAHAAHQIDRARDAVLRRTVWRGTAYRLLRQRGHDPGRAATLADRVWSVSESEVVLHRSPYVWSFYSRDGGPRVDPAAAFPAAHGYGAPTLTSCGRSTVHLLRITSLDFSDPGNFEAAFDSADALPNNDLKIIEPRTSGRTFSGYEGNVRCVYYAGQAGPGHGLTISNRLRAMYVTAGHDLRMEGLRIEGQARDEATSVEDVTIDAFSRLYWRHNTQVFSTEQALGLHVFDSAGVMEEVTLEGNIIALPNAGAGVIQPTAMQVSMCSGSCYHAHLGPMSWSRNVFHSVHHRAPLINQAVDSLPSRDDPHRMVGQLWYNGGEQANAQLLGWIDILDSRVVGGPATRYDPGSVIYAWMVSLGGMRGVSSGDTTASLYGERLLGMNNGSITVGMPDLVWAETDKGGDGTVDSLQAEIAGYYKTCRDPAGGGDPRAASCLDWPDSVFRDTALTPEPIPTPRVNPTGLLDSLAGSSDADIKFGRHRGRTCTGVPEQRVDSLLSALAAEMRAGTGISNWQNVDAAFVDARNDYPLGSSTPCTDADGNGLWDDFEVEYFGSTGQAYTGDPDGDGWTNGEEQYNGTDPTSADPLDSGGGSGGSQFTATFFDGDSRAYSAYRTDASVTDTIHREDGTVDTVYAYADIPEGANCTPLHSPHDTLKTEVIILCTDELSAPPAQLDSAALDDTLQLQHWDLPGLDDAGDVRIWVRPPGVSLLLELLRRGFALRSSPVLLAA